MSATIVHVAWTWPRTALPRFLPQAQVVGCALTYGVAAMLLGLWRRPGIVVTGMAGGFWTAWVLHAASGDQSGLFVVGAIVLAPLLP